MLKSILSTVQCPYDGPLGAHCHHRLIRYTTVRLRACRFRSASVIGCALMTAYPGKGGGAGEARYSRFECLSSGFAGFTDQWNSTSQGSLGRSLKSMMGRAARRAHANRTVARARDARRGMYWISEEYPDSPCTPTSFFQVGVARPVGPFAVVTKSLSLCVHNKFHKIRVHSEDP